MAQVLTLEGRMEWKFFELIERYRVYTDGMPCARAVSLKWDKRFHSATDAIEDIVGPDRSLRLGVMELAVLIATVGAQEAEILIRFLREEMRRSGPGVAWELMERLRTGLVARSR